MEISEMASSRFVPNGSALRENEKTCVRICSSLQICNYLRYIGPTPPSVTSAYRRCHCEPVTGSSLLFLSFVEASYIELICQIKVEYKIRYRNNCAQ